MNEDLMQAGKRYIELKERKDELEDALKEVKEALDQTSSGMVERMNEMELDRFSAFGRTFSVNRKLVANCLAEDRERLHELLRENGYGSLIREEVKSQTLNAFAKEQLSPSGELPEWMASIVTTFFKTDISVRKAGRA